MDKIYSVRETAQILSLNEETLRRYIKAGKIRASKIGKVWRIQEEDIKAFLDSKTQEALNK